MSGPNRPTDPAGRPFLQRCKPEGYSWSECHPDDVPERWGLNHSTATEILKGSGGDGAHLYAFAWDPNGMRVPLRVAVVCAPLRPGLGADPRTGPPVRWPTVDEIAAAVRAVSPQGAWYHPGLVPSAGVFTPGDYTAVVLQLVGADSSTEAGRLLQLAGGTSGIVKPNGSGPS